MFQHRTLGAEGATLKNQELTIFGAYHGNRRLVLHPPITDVDCVEHRFEIWKLRQEDDKCRQKFRLCFLDVSGKVVHCWLSPWLGIYIFVCIEVEMRQVPHITRFFDTEFERFSYFRIYWDCSKNQKSQPLAELIEMAQ